MEPIEFSPPDITEKEIEAVVETLQSGWITTGPKTKEFEKAISQFCNTEKTVCLNSATAAMELTLRLLGVGEGDEVITTAYTYSASASVIHHVGAKIVFVDVAKDSFHIDYEALEKAITKKTKVIIPVDIAGVPCDYGKIFEIIERKKDLFSGKTDLQKDFNRIIVLADAAHSLGATYNNKKVGSIADFTAFSFHAVKNLTTAEGGAVTWHNQSFLDNEKIYKQFMLYSLHGQSKDALAKTNLGSWEYDIIEPLYKCNMTDISAAMGLSQLNRYTNILQRRKEIVSIYEEELSKIPNVTFLRHFTDSVNSSAHLFFIRIDGIDEKKRNDIILEMVNRGIVTNVHYKPLPMMTAYKNLGFSIENFPNAYNQYKNEISLPLYSTLTDNQIRYVCTSLREVLEELS